ncbi:MAG: hypothetical protein AAFR16_07005, partial [Pseudomonadota bacterium]
MSGEEFNLPERVTVEQAQEALQTAASLAPDASMLIDASQVECIDGGSVLAFANIARSFASPDSGRAAKLAVLNPTPAFV